MKTEFTKIAFIFGLGLFLYACNAVEKVPEGDYLLVKNNILVNQNTSNDEGVINQLYQIPNKKLLGIPYSLHIYNLSKDSATVKYENWLDRKPGRRNRFNKVLSEKQVERLGQSFIVSGYSDMLKHIGQAPVILDTIRTNRSVERIKNYYFNQGYFNVNADYKVDSVDFKRAELTYNINTGDAYFIDSLRTNISTYALDSLYQLSKNLSIIKPGKQYNRIDLDAERNRLTTYFRNRGAYFFQQSYINYQIDTVDTGKKANIDLVITDQNVRKNDQIYTKKFNLYKISEINLFTNNPYDKRTSQIVDSTSYKGINIYSSGKLRFRPKAITDPVFLTIGQSYSDFRDQLTRRYLNNLGIFNYPTIQYVEDESDSTGNSLIANIRLSSMPRYRFNPSIDLTHSNIQDFGIEGNMSVSARNVFKGAEVLQVGLRGNVGSSRDLANPNDVFFNILEYGADVKINFPRILFPFNTEKIIPRNMIPTTVTSVGFFKQENIGLDKENVSSIINYSWTPSRRATIKMDLLNAQYVRNINAQNYFNVYNSSYDRLNDLAEDYGANPDYLDVNGNLERTQGTRGFISDVLSGDSSIPVNSRDYKVVSSIEERRKRLTEDNLIVATNITYERSNQTNIYDNTFHRFKVKVESAGTILSLISKLSNKQKNQNDNYEALNVVYSQYIKTEAEYVKHWDLGSKTVLASRIFGGIAIPYGNSSNIPFSRSYFAGGSNDNRGWQAYSLGPGSSGSQNDFNEANMKLAANIEYRFPIGGKLGGALFVDAGNIWNALDDIEDEQYVFNSFNSLKNIAVSSGLGFRYDFGFVIFRLDLGFKTYNPAENTDNRWFRNYKFSESVLNIGINYPF